MSQQPKKVLFIFAKSAVRKKRADPERLQQLMQEAAEMQGSNMQIYISYPRSLSFFVGNDKVKIRDHRNHMNLEEYDFVYLRKAGSAMQQMLTVALYLIDHDIPFFDHEIARSTSRNKLSQMYMLQRRGVPIAKTLFCRNNRRLLRLVSKKYANEFSFPLIAKATGGTRGDANYLVSTLGELETIIKNENRHFMIQEYIPNDGDMRFFIVNGALKGVIGRQSVDGSHLNNTSQGGDATIIAPEKIAATVREDALLAARVFQRDCAGVDVIFNRETGEHSILEVNRAPQIEHASFEQEKAMWMVSSIEDLVNCYQPDSRIKEQNVFGRFETVRITDSNKVVHRLVAKIDTGADSSSLHATQIRHENDTLSCMINDELFTFNEFTTKRIVSSNGIAQERYIVSLNVMIGGYEYTMKVSLSDRSRMKQGMLIGRRFLRSNHLLVNVGRRHITSQKKKETVT